MWVCFNIGSCWHYLSFSTLSFYLFKGVPPLLPSFSFTCRRCVVVVVVVVVVTPPYVVNALSPPCSLSPTGRPAVRRYLISRTQGVASSASRWVDAVASKQPSAATAKRASKTGLR